jgi:DNA adenine methylase
MRITPLLRSAKREEFEDSVSVAEESFRRELVERMKPFLKWVGGKTQIIHQVLEKFPREIANYYEPFLGGGSVLLALLSDSTIKIHGKIIASDLNSNIIGLYRNVQSRVEELITEVGILVAEYAQCKGTVVNRKPLTMEDAMTSPESYYFWIRSRFNALNREERQSVKASAMLLFMNKTCFRGVYREGPHGINVPYGNYKNPTILDADHIRKVSHVIQPVVFICQDFREALSTLCAGDFVYLDPPYAPENEKSFVSYTADGFDLNAHKALFDICGGFIAKNIGMLMSNADVELVREAFKDGHEVRTISCRRAINSTNPEARTNEVLIRNLLTEHTPP